VNQAKPINARAYGVGFCVDFDSQGSPEPQNSNEANESARFSLCIMQKYKTTNNNLFKPKSRWYITGNKQL
jgi:hypothetical protein